MQDVHEPVPEEQKQVKEEKDEDEQDEEEEEEECEERNEEERVMKESKEVDDERKKADEKYRQWKEKQWIQTLRLKRLILRYVHPQPIYLLFNPWHESTSYLLTYLPCALLSFHSSLESYFLESLR